MIFPSVLILGQRQEREKEGEMATEGEVRWEASSVGRVRDGLLLQDGEDWGQGQMDLPRARVH